MEARLTAVVDTRGAAKADRELNAIAKTSKVVDINVRKTERSFKSFGSSAASAVAAVDGPLGGISSRITALTSLVSKGNLAVTGLAVGLTAAAAAIAQGVFELDRLNVSLAKSEALVLATGSAAGFSAKQLQENAQALALNTLASTEEIQRAQGILQTFNRVSEDVFTRAIVLAQDLATVYGGDAASQATQLGKALQDPIKGITALNRVGVTFSKTQQDQIKGFVDIGDAASAQEIILSNLAAQVGGAGAAVAKGSLAGAFDTTTQRYTEFTASLAGSTGVYTGLIGLVNTFNDGLLSLSNTLNQNSDANFQALVSQRMELQEQLNQLAEDDGLDFLGSVFGSSEAEAELIREQIKSIESELTRIQELNKAKAIEENNALEEGRKTRAEIRKSESEALKAEADERAATEKQKDDERLERQKNSALAQLEVLTALNDSELEAINRKEQQRLEKIKSFRDQELILDSEFQLAKTEIELAAENERQTLKDEIAQKDKERAEESSRLFTDSAKTLTDGLLDAALAGDSLKDSLLTSIQSIAQGIIQTGIEQLVQQQVISRITGALFTAEKTAEVSATVAQAGLNAFASTAAIPVVGPAAAPAAAAAAITAASALGAGVVAASAAREQGGQLSAGQSSTVAERGQLEILTPSSSSRIRTAQQMRQIMGDNSSATVNFTVIDQSTGEKEYQQERNDDGSMTLLIRNVVAGDAANANSQIRKSFDRNTNLRSAR